MADPNINDNLAPRYGSYRETAAGDAAIQELESALSQPTPKQQPAPAAPIQPQGSTAGAIASDIGKGLAVEAPGQIVGGMADAVNHVSDMAHELAGWLNNNVADLGSIKWGRHGLEWVSGVPKDNALQVPTTHAPTTKTGGLVRGVSQFLTGFVGAGKLLDGAGLLASAPKTAAAVKGAISNFTTTDPHAGRLSDLVQQHPSLANPVTDFLSSKPGDNAAESRAKTALEGLGLGALTDGMVSALKYVRSTQAAQKIINPAAAEAAPPTVVTPEDFGSLGNPESDALIQTPNDMVKTPALDVLRQHGYEPVVDGQGNVTIGGKIIPFEKIRALNPAAVLKFAEGITGKGPTAPTPKTLINWSRIDTPDDVKSVMQQMADHFHGDVSGAQRGVRSWQDTQLAADQEDAWKVLVDRRASGAATPLNAEQSLAARRLWAASAAKLKDVAQLAADAPNEANLFAFRKQLAVHQAIQNEVLAARTETARALNQWKIPAGGGPIEMGRAVEDVLNANGGPEVARELAQRVAKMAGAKDMAQNLEGFVEKGAFVKSMDAVRQVWINNLLSNPTTWAVNGIGNTAVALQQMGERRFAEALSSILGTEHGAAQGEARAMAQGALSLFGDAGTSFSEAWAQSHGALSGFKDGMVAAWRALKVQGEEIAGRKIDAPNYGGALSADTWSVANDSGLGRALDVINGTSEIPGRVLGATDNFFKSIGYRMALHAHALRQATSEVHAGTIPADQLKSRIAEIIQNPPEDIKLSAADQALYATFTQKPAEVLDALGKAIQRVPVAGRYFLPFRKTPINIMTYAFERTPFAPLVKSWRADIAAGGARRDIALARMGLGTAILSASADYAMNGRITGQAPSEPGARSRFLREGKQEYSVKVGDRWYAYNRVDPIGFALGLGADMSGIILNAQGQDAEVEKAMTAASLAFAQNIMSKQYLSSVSQFFDAMADPQRYGETFWQRAASSLVPAGVANVARQVDPYMREAQSMVDAIKKRTPYWSKDLPMYRDLLGRPVSYKSGLGTAYDLLSPVYVKSEHSEPVDAEMERLGYAPLMPPRKTSFDGVTVDLSRTPGAYERFVQLAGNEAKDPAWNQGAMDYLNAVIQGKSPMSQVYELYTDGPDGGKAAFIRQTLSHYRELAKRKILAEYPVIQAEVAMKSHQSKVKMAAGQ